MPNLIVTVTDLQRGQPRPYADHQHIAEVKVEERRYFSTDPHWRIAPCPHVDRLEMLALAVLNAPTARRDWNNQEYRDRNFWQSYTDYVHHVNQNGEEIKETPKSSLTGIVRIRIVEPYVD
jgi:hypothetical protein